MSDPSPESLAEVDRLFCVDDNPTVSDLKRAVARALAERNARIADLRNRERLAIIERNSAYDRIALLEAEVSALKELAQRYHDEAARDLEIRVKTVEVRKAQLRRHGTHTGDCKRFGTPPECTCGWTAIAEGLHGD